MKSDLLIANECEMLPIEDIAKNLGLCKDDISLYGKYKAKILKSAEQKLKDKDYGHLVLVTAINPTPAGEGKTTISIGLADALSKLSKKAVLALREPSLGPVFGIKGGAAGGGYAQVVPMEDINLHFTGDIHAITSTNNLLCALIDNHIQQGNELNIDPRRIVFKRCLDMNDRALRFINVGLGGKVNGVPREDGFDISVASEIMAILCLSEDIDDLKRRFSNILIGYSYSNNPIFVKDLGVQGAMASLMTEAIMPNLVQTLNKTPAIIHGGPFANIAHGCNSVKATKLAMKLGDYAITEAGFGSDLGAEKFLDIKCRYANIAPSCIVIVATVKALKYNGGVLKENLNEKNLEALSLGCKNLEKHIKNMKSYGVNVVVAINKFENDSDDELKVIENCCIKNDCEFSVSTVFKDGAKGGEDLARKVISCCDKKSDFKLLYDDSLSLKEKMNKIAKNIYGAKEVIYSKSALKELSFLEKEGFDKLPVCVCKTQYSLSDDPTVLGCPKDFTIHINDIKLSAGAGFVIFLTGSIMTMPGLPKKPAALSIDVVNDKIEGLF